MDKQEVIQEIGRSRILPVIRTRTTDDARVLVDAVVRGGCRMVELTLTIPDAVEVIREVADRYEDVIVGAGTVSSRQQAKDCIAAGAAFIVSPWTDADVIGECNSAGVTVMAGALTPTEVRSATTLGSDIVKIFPVESIGGASHVRALMSVMPDSRLVPTGGVTVENAADFLRAGALAVGIGSDLADVKDLRSNDDSAVILRISGLVSSLRDL